jgi:hypothetical protein
MGPYPAPATEGPPLAGLSLSALAVASRLTAAASAGELLIDAATDEAVAENYPEAERLDLRLKGKRTPVDAYAIKVARTAQPYSASKWHWSRASRTWRQRVSVVLEPRERRRHRDATVANGSISCSRYFERPRKRAFCYSLGLAPSVGERLLARPVVDG